MRGMERAKQGGWKGRVEGDVKRWKIEIRGMESKK